MPEPIPMVSVIIPAFNRADLVSETLRSVQRQAWSHWEAVVVDDGSSEETLRRLAECEHQDPRIRVLRRDRLPKGASTCRNIGLAAARGEYIIFLDSDDILAPNCLEGRAAAIRENPACDFLVFQGLLFNSVPGDSQLPWNTASGESDLCRFLRGNFGLADHRPHLEKGGLATVKGFDEQLACWQDVDIHLCALALGLKYLKKMETEPDYYIRRHGFGSISQNGFKSREAVGSLFRVFHKASEMLKPSITPDIKHGLRQMLAHGVQLALNNRFFDLARDGIKAGTRQHLLTPSQQAIWKLALASYAIHSKGFRGFAHLGKSLMEPFQPRQLQRH